MQKQQVFKVKGMQRDASMANANGEFAYEILNMRLMPAEDLSGFSLTNEKGTTKVITGIDGQMIGQCPTNDSLVVFTIGNNQDHIYKIYQNANGDWTYTSLYSGNLNFSVDYPIEALFNYETEDIQKVYWIDGLNQLRCMNIATSDTDRAQWNNQSFDSIKEINSIPSVEIERVVGGSFTAGVIQYYVTYFNKYSSESPIVYTSPLLYIAHDNRGANVNDQVSTALKLTFTDLDIDNWEYMRIYITHRTSLDATPEASIVTELNMKNSTIEFTDSGSNRTSIAPTDLYFIGGKFVKAGTMTVKDQVMFLGNLNLTSPNTVDIVGIQELFDSIRDLSNHPLSTTTTKTKENKLEDYEETHYYYKNQLNNTESITHYKYGEKYRFGISVLDKYGNWSNPIWIKDAFIEVPPTQVDADTISLSCPSLKLDYILTFKEKTQTLLQHLTDLGAKNIKPLIVFPSVEERKVVAQGVVCPTVYNLKDRKENGPYVQASWFMRPNVPVDLWGVDSIYLGLEEKTKLTTIDGNDLILDNFSHKSDIQLTGHKDASYFGVSSDSSQLVLDDFTIKPAPNLSATKFDVSFNKYSRNNIYSPWNSKSPQNLAEVTKEMIVKHGTWVEFRHNYSLRTKGFTYGGVSASQNWAASELQYTNNNINFGMVRGAELDPSRFAITAPVNRVIKNLDGSITAGYGEKAVSVNEISNGTSAYYVDNSIITLNSPEIELSESLHNLPVNQCNFRIIGCIPITGTSSDISIEVTNPESNPAESDSVGLQKIFIQNKSIGIHGFKGLVSTNAYYSYYADTEGQDGKPLYYGLLPLYPWQSVGSVGMYGSENEKSGSISLLKKKVLSNLRYSASSFFFKPGTLVFADDANEIQDKAYLSSAPNNCVGWKPSKGCFISAYTDADTNKIIKLEDLGYSEKSLVYRGSISESIAVLASGTNGDKPEPSWIYGYGQRFNVGESNKPNDLESMKYAPAIAASGYDKTAKGASIKYKSSPHYIIGFNCLENLWGTTLKIQETLPAWRGINEEGLLSYIKKDYLIPGYLYEDQKVASLYHQNYIYSNDDEINFGIPNRLYGSNKQVEVISKTDSRDKTIDDNGNISIEGNTISFEYTHYSSDSVVPSTYFQYNDNEGIVSIENKTMAGVLPLSNGTAGLWGFTLKYDSSTMMTLEAFNAEIRQGNQIYKITASPNKNIQIQEQKDPNFQLVTRYIITLENCTISVDNKLIENETITVTFGCLIENQSIEVIKAPAYGWLWLGEIYRETDPTFGGTSDWALQNNQWETGGTKYIQSNSHLYWSQGDTYYQRFDTLKTYAYSDSDQNSVVDITSFMVETRINIDGRYDRNRGQESNLQMSPTNFNLMNDVYSQKDNFFTYRILDEDLQARTNFPNQITWSLTKTAGATVDAWMNITLASILDLDGTKGELVALKNFNNNIIAFQEKGLSHIMFNSRAQIATSEAVPIQIANTGKVDGQQYFTTDVGCQDKWNIVTTPNGLYFIDYFNKSIYRFNGKLEDISTPNGFRSWCYENLNSTANIIGYYDVKNKEVMYYIGDTRFELSQQYLDSEELKSIKPQWLGFSELTGVFSSFYTYPKAWFANVQDQGLWLLSEDDFITVYTHQTGKYNQLLNTSEPFYGLTVIPRQDSNIVKTFNNVEFRADSFDDNGYNEDLLPVDTISAETEYQVRTVSHLTYNQYRPSNLKKKLRTWRANIPRVNNGYKRFVNQWAKIGLWKMNPSKEKTILHDLSVWYSE